MNEEVDPMCARCGVDCDTGETLCDWCRTWLSHSRLYRWAVAKFVWVPQEVHRKSRIRWQYLRIRAACKVLGHDVSPPEDMSIRSGEWLAIECRRCLARIDHDWGQLEQ